MRRSECVMGEEETYRLLREALWVTLSTVNARVESPLGLGSPYAVPISVVESDGQFYFHAAKTGHKIDNLKADDRVCITCVGTAKVDEPGLTVIYESAIFFATAEEVTAKGEIQRMLASLCKRFAPSQNVESQLDALPKNMSIWKFNLLGCSGKHRKFE